MIVDKDGNIAIVTNEKMKVTDFIEKLNADYGKIAKDNIIINLFSINALSTADLLEFLPLATSHKEEAKKSFVIVAKGLSIDELPETLEVVPTEQEAYDIIEMEEIERDLNLDE